LRDILVVIVKVHQSLIASLCVFAGLALAPRPAAASCPSFSLECFYVRNVGVMHLSTALAQADEVVLENVVGPATLVVQDGPIAGSSSSIKALTLPALSLGFIIRDTENSTLGVELILAPPNMAKIEMRAEGTLADESLAPYALGNIPTGVPPAGHELGTVSALPPMATVVYRPMKKRRFRPYAGAGLGYMIITGGDITNPLLTSVAKPRLEAEHGFGNLGVVVQGGLDVRVARWKRKNLYFSADIKYIGFLRITAKVKDIYVEAPGLPLFGPVKVGDAGASVTVNPLIFQAGLGLDF
jgi:outer membrane protein W